MAVAETRIGQAYQSVFEDVFSNHHKKVYQYALRITRNPHDAEDATQETFLKVYRAMPKFRGDCSISTWIFRIAANVCMDSLRSPRKREVPCLDGQKELDTPGFQVADTSADPSDIAETVDIREGVMDCLKGLGKDQRTVLYLREIGDLSYTDIAAIMGCPMGTVKSKLNRAREALKKEVSEKVLL